ncbi:ATP-binding cassette domain-containing protein [Nonomuraea salmonea]|uniref:ATP-binding cassette domain-containing protein n=1 Tax=Nonomuraea salmonea TaxID=46181 RepID=UPI002FEC2CAF
MTAVVTAHGVTKRFGDVTALDDVSFALAEHTIYGLLGRNGAGKTTLMQILTGQAFASSGNVSVFDAPPVENPAVLSKVCFVRESQRYPPTSTPCATSFAPHAGCLRTGTTRSRTASPRTSSYRPGGWSAGSRGACCRPSA